MIYLLILIVLIALIITIIAEVKISPDKRNLSELRKVWSRWHQRGHIN